MCYLSLVINFRGHVINANINTHKYKYGHEYKQVTFTRIQFHIGGTSVNNHTYV